MLGYFSNIIVLRDRCEFIHSLDPVALRVKFDFRAHCVFEFDLLKKFIIFAWVNLK